MPARRLHAVSPLRSDDAWTPGVPRAHTLAPPDAEAIFLAPPEPADPPARPLDPAWEELRQFTGEIARECYQPEHGRPAMAMARLIDEIIRRTDVAASVISFADLHDLIVPILIGEEPP